MRTPTFWVIGFLYLSVFFLGMFFIFFRKEFLSRIAWWAMRIGFLFHLALFIMDWNLSGTFPLRKASLMAVALLLVMKKYLKKDLIHVAIFTALIVVGELFLSYGHDPRDVISAVHDSRWLIVHVVFAQFSVGCLIIATALAIIYFIKTWKPDFLPSFYTLEGLDRITYKLVGLGVIFQLGMNVAGMFWAKELYGRFWGWDPVENWSLIVFLFYLLYLHARLLLKISGKTAAIMLVVGFILLAISFYGIPLVSPIEHLDKPLESLTR